MRKDTRLIGAILSFANVMNSKIFTEKDLAKALNYKNIARDVKPIINFLLKEDIIEKVKSLTTTIGYRFKDIDKLRKIYLTMLSS